MSAALRALTAEGQEAAVWRLLLRAAATRPDAGAHGLACDAQGHVVETAPGDAAALASCELHDGHMRWRACGPTLAAPAREMLEIYVPALELPATGIAAVAHLGQSLDGFVATANGASHYVTGERNLVHLHRMRALFDAVVVGAETARADNPRLTVRRVDGPDPLRVVLDPRQSLTPSLEVMKGSVPTLLIHAGPGPDAAPAAGPTPGRAWLDAEGGRLDPGAVLAELARRGVRRVFVEGGGRTVSTFHAAGTLQRLHIAVAPVLIGRGRPGVQVAPAAHMDEALRPACRRFEMGEDVLFDFDLTGCWPQRGAGGLSR